MRRSKVRFCWKKPNKNWKENVMAKTLWEIAKIGGTLIGILILSALVGDASGEGYPSHRRNSCEPTPRIYRPTGGTRGFGTRGYEHHR